jgi:hypothetical protein
MKTLRWLFICVALALAFGVYAFYYGPAKGWYYRTRGPVKGWYYRTFRTPAILYSTFIVDFDKQHAAAQRQKLFEVYQAKSGSYGLRKVDSSIEGTPVGVYLIVESGRTTLIADFTQDSYGDRRFDILYPTNIVLAPVTASETSQSSVTPVETVVLKCYLAKGVISF